MDLVEPLRASVPAKPLPRLRDEVVATLMLALPLAATQLGQIAITTTDIAVLGHLGARELAAASLGHAIYWPCFLFGMGIATATSPLVAQALGARRGRAVRRAAQQGLLAAILSALPLMLLLWQTGPILVALGQEPELAANAERFGRALLWGLPAAVGFIALRGFTTAFGTTRAVLVITLAGIVLNLALNWVLVFGHLGVPPLGLVGSGTASAIVNTLMFLALLHHATRAPRHRRYAILAGLGRLDLKAMGEVLRVGTPIAVTLLMETMLFSATTLLMGRLGAIQVAAHQITLQICAITFMVPLGISLAATIRVAVAAGAGDRLAARRAGQVAAALGIGVMAIAASVFLIVPEQLVALFVRADDPLGAPVVAFGASLLLIAAIFQIVDGLQVIAGAALRGLKDTTVPMLMAVFGYWCVGFPAAAILGFQTTLGGHGIWLGIAISLALVAVMMSARFLGRTRVSAWRTGG